MLASPRLPPVRPPANRECTIQIQGTYSLMLTPRSADTWATPVSDALLISGARTCCVSHRRIPHNSTAFIYGGKSCHSLTELPKQLQPEPTLWCCTRQGQPAKTTVPGFLVSPRATMLLRHCWCVGCSVSLLPYIAPRASAAVSQMETFSIHDLL